jgi:hypothetical protein
MIVQSKKLDANMASYLNVPKLSLDCKAGIAQLDLDLSQDPVNVKKIEALTKYANEDSQDFKDCYSAVAWLYYSGAKVEGAIRTWIKKIAEIGIMQ